MDPSASITPPLVAGPLRLEPFRALRLVPSRVGDPSSGRAFARPYRDVAARLVQWEERGYLVHDAEPALYLHEYTSSGMTVRGLVGALDVSRRATRPEDRAILPHEGIYPSQADDLADRMAEMQLNPAAILLVQRSPADLRALLRSVRRRPPTHQFVDRLGQAQRIWAIRDDAELDEIATLLGPTQALIADGHHRYAAYLRLQQREPGPSTNVGLAMIVDQDDTPLFLGAIHRVLAGTSVADVRSAATSLSMPTRLTSSDDAVGALGPTTLVATDGEEWLTVDIDVPSGRAMVELLHESLVPVLAHGPTGISYHHTVNDALLNCGPHLGTAVLMPAPDLDTITRIAAANRLLPEKATSFQPKAGLGVLIRSLRDG